MTHRRFVLTVLLWIATTSFLSAQSKPVKPANASDNEWKPVAELKLNSTLIKMTIDAEGKYLYWLNTSDGKLQRLALADKEPKLDKVEIELAEGACDWAMTPDKKYAFVCATSSANFREETKPTGQIQKIDLATQKIESTFTLKFNGYQIVAPSAETVVLAPGGGQWVNIVAVDVKKKSISGNVVGSYGQPDIQILPDATRLYVSTNGLSPGSTSSCAIEVNNDRARPNFGGSNTGGGPFSISPDGKFAVMRNGFVGRISKSKDTDLREAGKVKPHRSAVFCPDAGFALLATSEGEIIRYSLPDFEMIETYSVPKPIYSMTIDTVSKRLFAALDNKKQDDSSRPWNQTTNTGVGNLAVFDIAKLFQKMK